MPIIKWKGNVGDKKKKVYSSMTGFWKHGKLADKKIHFKIFEMLYKYN